MLNVNVRSLAGIVDALLKGDDNLVSSLIEKKLERMGQNLILQLLPTSGGGMQRAVRAVRTGGASEFMRARNAWLNQLQPTPLPGSGILKKFADQLQQSGIAASRPEGKHWEYSKSRREWLDRSWRHDWRSQPRDFHGRWIPGRLKSPYVPRRLKRRQRALRRIARRAIKDSFRGN